MNKEYSRRQLNQGLAVLVGAGILGIGGGTVAAMLEDLEKPDYHPVYKSQGNYDTKSIVTATPKIEAVNSTLELDPLKIRKMSLEPINGKHTLTVPQITEVLRINNAHPDLIAAASSIDKFAKKYNIDNAWVEVFGMKESGLGRAGAATTTKSIGNIRLGSYSYADVPYWDYNNGIYGHYRGYTSWDRGIEDYFALLRYGYLEGKIFGIKLKTPEEIIPYYAPSDDDNVPELYIKHTCYWMSQLRQGQFKFTYPEA